MVMVVQDDRVVVDGEDATVDSLCVDAFRQVWVSVITDTGKVKTVRAEQVEND